jgi:hypothetical protein
MSEILSGLLLGAGFGFVLERAGFGNPNKLTGQFRLTDWSVFKVMFTAIVFAAVGLLILGFFGYYLYLLFSYYLLSLYYIIGSL